jgi:hypothetical protein
MECCEYDTSKVHNGTLQNETQHNGIHHNDTQDKSSQSGVLKHKYYTEHPDLFIMKSVIVLSDFIPIVTVPKLHHICLFSAWKHAQGDC